ncbi:hypothetical protein [Campylobacter sp. JMF_08 NE1]|uniref:hypothetical protein n=1 Tax=Campylobacter sp. JMF_08 NE1 TaxID=2983821 RepID=UPI0022E9EB8B|nr:hypothetical protein [Campylobacter sp. JMF_08 NE1]
MIINNYDNFDSIVLGSSMLENTSAKEASQNLGAKFVNLSLAGSDLFERSLILEYILRQKQLKKIIYSFDYNVIIGARKGAPEYNFSKFKPLYANNKFEKYKVYFDKYVFITTLKSLFSCQKFNIDTPREWASKFNINDYGFENWIKMQTPNAKTNIDDIKNRLNYINSSKKQILKNLNEQITNSKIYVDEYILKFVSQNPQTEFYIVLPPYSRIHNAIEFHTKKRDFLVTKEVLRYLVEQSQIYKNLKIYAWGDTDYPDDIANYKDLTHYSHKFNSQMLLYLKDGTGLLTPQNFDEYYDKFEQKSREFDLMPYYEKIK